MLASTSGGMRGCCRFRMRVRREMVPATRFAATLNGFDVDVAGTERIESIDSFVVTPRCGTRIMREPGDSSFVDPSADHMGINESIPRIERVDDDGVKVGKAISASAAFSSDA